MFIYMIAYFGRFGTRRIDVQKKHPHIYSKCAIMYPGNKKMNKTISSRRAVCRNQESIVIYWTMKRR